MALSRTTSDTRCPLWRGEKTGIQHYSLCQFSNRQEPTTICTESPSEILKRDYKMLLQTTGMSSYLCRSQVGGLFSWIAIQHMPVRFSVGYVLTVVGPFQKHTSADDCLAICCRPPHWAWYHQGMLGSHTDGIQNHFGSRTQAIRISTRSLISAAESRLSAL